jgi:predicted outer membrane protein
MHRRRRLLVAIGVVGWFGFGLGVGQAHVPSAWAAGERSTDTTKPERMSKDWTAGELKAADSGQHEKPVLTDAMVLNRLHALNTFEIKAGEMATTHAGSASISTFGQRLVDDHKKIDSRLLALIRQMDVSMSMMMSLPTSAGNRYRMDQEVAKLNELDGRHGNAFDKPFLELTLDSNNEALDFLHDAIDSVHDKGVRKLLEDTIPIVMTHVQIVTDLTYQPGRRVGRHPHSSPRAPAAP